MGYQANYSARTFSKGTKALILYRQRDSDGVARCAKCTAVLVKGAFRFDHVIPWELCQYSGPSNGHALCLPCDAIKTYRHDIPMIADNNRMRARHEGRRRKARHPMPCGRDSQWSKPVGAFRPVPRTSQTEKLHAVLARRQILTEQAEA